MSDEIKSNITISSNISDYNNFEKYVVGFTELKKIPEKTDKQNKLYRKGALPYYCNNESSWGYIKLENGEIVHSCRCEIIECKHYNTCMEEPYSKKIVREDKSKYDSENNNIEKPDWKTK